MNFHSEPERARRTLSGGVLLFRWVSLTWMISLNVVAGEFRRPALAWAGLAAAGLWTLWLTLPRGGRQREHPFVLSFDLALSIGLIVLSGAVVPPGRALMGRLFYATAYPLSTALLWGATYGFGGALLSAAGLGAALVASRPVNGQPLSELTTTGWLSLGNGLVNYLLAGGVAGVVSRHLDRSTAQLRSTVDVALDARERAARLAERESLARAIHDSVLQALAYINKRGHELAVAQKVSGPDVADLADLAAKQERELRTLFTREPERAPAGARSLRDALEEAAREVTALPVTMSAVGPIWLPAREVGELTAAVRQALENVVEHAGATRAAVFAEVEEGWVAVSVRDDGTGFVYDEQRLRSEGSLGMLRSMKGRIEDLGGRMRVLTAPGAGTEVEFRVPIRGDGP